MYLTATYRITLLNWLLYRKEAAVFAFIIYKQPHLLAALSGLSIKIVYIKYLVYNSNILEPSASVQNILCKIELLDGYSSCGRALLISHTRKSLNMLPSVIISVQNIGWCVCVCIAFSFHTIVIHII